MSTKNPPFCVIDRVPNQIARLVCIPAITSICRRVTAAPVATWVQAQNVVLIGFDFCFCPSLEFHSYCP
ncbi:hypothetical protein L596_027350 [Steinernema carpocapsae]|uniref:Uncharacterized protein n=1 Tax=Steinernema carpocapsae TaxID=34508 RepID=A0A4U5M425_STECR|nr:hypothetical protein L596_027350 [Steinernema carpocapsae]